MTASVLTVTNTTAMTRCEAAILAAQEREKAQRERRERIDREARQRELADLRFQVRSHQVSQSGVQNAVRQTIATQQQQALLADLERHFNPPPPPPEPEVIYVEPVEGSDQLGTSDFNPTLWMQKSRSWW